MSKATSGVPTRICSVTDLQTAVGLKLTGISEARVVSTPLEAKAHLVELANDPTVAMIIVTEEIADAHHYLLQKLLTSETFPIVVEIPDKNGPKLRINDPIKEMVRRALGIEVNQPETTSSSSSKTSASSSSSSTSSPSSSSSA